MKEWNLKEIFADNEALKQGFDELNKLIPTLASYQGKLNNKKTLSKFFYEKDEFEKKFEKALSYVYMQFDLNQSDLDSQQNMGYAQNTYMKYAEAMAFVDNEILATPLDTYKAWAKEDNIINEHLFGIIKTFDSRSHVLSEKEERLLSYFGKVNDSFSSLYAMLENSDTKPVEVTLTNGEKITITKNNYTSYLGKLNNQEDRRLVFEADYKHYDDHKNTYAAIYKGIIEKDIANMKARGYSSILSSFLEDQKIPEDVYLSLINTVRANTQTLKDYINLRKEMFNLKEYHTYDRILNYAHSDVSYSYEGAYNEVMKALQPMGEDFINHAKIALKEGHVDVYPHEGKRSGAYSTEIYGYGPYILLNHTDDLESAFTLAHECGHSIHTMYSLENQPYATKDYVIFVAEIASTFNEQLFLDYLLKTSNDKNTKIQAIEQQIDGIVSTFYRQTLFADFEYQAHQKALNGEEVTYEMLNNIMKELYMTYYGIDLETEPLKKYVWAYIPHLFNSPFYVYQYATCLSASMEIYQNVKNNVPGAKEAYINMLKSGGCDYPVEIVKKGGVDLTTPAPFIAVCNKLGELTKELKELISK